VKIAVINGTEKRGVTYRMKEIFLEQFRDDSEITEYYLPKDGPGFCMGCTACFRNNQIRCKDSEKVQKIEDKRKASFKKKLGSIAQKMRAIDYSRPGHTGVVVKAKFYAVRMPQTSLGKQNPEYTDFKYWNENGWIGKARPWKCH
jgi:hypothetical protein